MNIVVLAAAFAQATGGGSSLDIGTLIDRGGVVAFLSFALLGLARRWWVPGWVHEELKRDRDFWRETALKGMVVAEATAGLAERRAVKKST
jgi:hypothetical protein